MTPAGPSRPSTGGDRSRPARSGPPRQAGGQQPARSRPSRGSEADRTTARSRRAAGDDDSIRHATHTLVPPSRAEA